MRLTRIRGRSASSAVFFVRSLPHILCLGIYSSESCEIHWEISSFRETDAFCAVIAIKGTIYFGEFNRGTKYFPQMQGDILHGISILSKRVDYRRIWRDSYSLRLFHSKATDGKCMICDGTIRC